MYVVNHSMAFRIPNLESLGLEGYDPTAKGSYSLYVRCKDKNGNTNPNEYNINFCIQQGNDITPPNIKKYSPEKDEVGYNVTQQEVIFFTDEPSECKWDLNDKNYDEMINTLQCDNDVEDFEIEGWRCNGIFPVGNNEKKYYVRCKDQPWLRVNNGTGETEIVIDLGEDENGQKEEKIIPAPGRTRNTNTISYIFGLKRTEAQLIISSVEPNNITIFSGVEPVTITLKVKTEGGIDGTALCSYEYFGQVIPFRNTFSREHTQVFESFVSGEQDIPIYCEDSVGNTAKSSAKFKIEVDRTSPKITRIFDKDGSLVITTDEIAECFLSYENCNFDVRNGTKLNGDGIVHSISFEKGIVNYIQCKDSYGNSPGSCGYRIRGGIINAEKQL